MNVNELRNRINILLQTLKTDLINCGNISTLEDDRLILFCNKILEVTDIYSIPKILDF